MHYYASCGAEGAAAPGRAAGLLPALPRGRHRAAGFWAKRVPGGAPDWLTTLDVEHREGTFRQVVVADLPTLVWAANLGGAGAARPAVAGRPRAARPAG
ncbi:hypothetical protein GCM10020229_25970 [Kitasatospora albolonga]